MIELRYVTTAEEYKVAAMLFQEYATWLNIDLSFQKFDKELAELAEMYAAPGGCIILAKVEKEYIGCIAVRRLDDEVSEIKRMYVQPRLQKKGVGTHLLLEAISFAERTGYKKIRLDTLKHMTPAIKRYRANGFVEIPAYYHNPEPNAVYFEKKLR